MARVCFIGSGSAKFVAGLVRDLFTFEELHASEIVLMDIDEKRMDRTERLVQRIIHDLKLPATVRSTTDQRAAIAGADYVINTVMVGGFKHYESDGRIPARYGVLPTVGDTIGPGAVFRLIRTGPVLAEIAKNILEVAKPETWIFNYANPMAMNTWMLLDSGWEKTVGLCHSIQGSYKQIAGWLGLDPDKVTYTAGGINHVDFYLTLEYEGRDMYPMLLDKKEEILSKNPDQRVKFELLEHLGGWPAEGQHHQTEYYPWFRKDRETAEKHYAVETMWGYTFDKRINSELDTIVENQISGKESIDYKRSQEFGAWMIHSIETDTPRVIYGNVRNQGLIENLPTNAVVEVPCLVDTNGVKPCRVGRIPMPLAAAMGPHISIHEMAVEAVKRKDRRLIHQAIQADPMTSMVLTLPRIHEMVEELFEENTAWMTDWPEK